MGAKLKTILQNRHKGEKNGSWLLKPWVLVVAAGGLGWVHGRHKIKSSKNKNNIVRMPCSNVLLQTADLYS